VLFAFLFEEVALNSSTVFFDPVDILGDAGVDSGETFNCAAKSLNKTAN